MQQNIRNRQKMLSSLQTELVGPDPIGEPLDCSIPIIFNIAKESYAPRVQKDTGEEILQRDTPTKGYGIGVLYPLRTEIDELSASPISQITDSIISEDNESPNYLFTSEGAKTFENATNNVERVTTDVDTNDLDLSLTNTYRPSSMGISFLAEFLPGSKLLIEVVGGRYRQLDVMVEKNSRHWWLRNSVKITEECKSEAILSSQNYRLQTIRQVNENTDGLDLQVEIFCRYNPQNHQHNQRLVTICIVNRTEQPGNRLDEYCLFQSNLQVSLIAPDGKNHILPYPEAQTNTQDEEDLSMAMLYRNFATYGVGHGCAADWGIKDETDNVAIVYGKSMPIFETASITPEIKDSDGNSIQVAMAPLAGLVPNDTGFASLERVIVLYESWIRSKDFQITRLDAKYSKIARKHLDNCRKCANRMREGLEYLKADPIVFKAFQLANHAILLQQSRTYRKARSAKFNLKTTRFEFSPTYPKLDPTLITNGRGNWRAFQIAFLLMSICSTARADSEERDIVELIWFPTGGGKTEAYLGLAAFSIFLRRLRSPNDTGVNVLMRYTLRLLTAQQFQRASSLVCAMEYLRRKDVSSLGTTQFAIGIWVGGDNTPNQRSQAIEILKKLNAGDSSEENKFIINRCPWCGAHIGPLPSRSVPSKVPKTIGYFRSDNTVLYRCPDSNCDFSQRLPIYAIDEDIYEFRPDIVIGTVDKFATLTWRPESHSLFGLDESGARVVSPPGLIIQDELHLISGPLGSMVGLFEAVIEELCTDRRVQPLTKPKIVSSTATIRRYKEQIKALYAREEAVLFPPPGLDADDSFFARYARADSNNLEHGRMYVGIHAPGLGSQQTAQVRTFTSLFLAPNIFFKQNERDPWWTNLIFFNSLRELGTTLSLFQSDIPDYIKVKASRAGISFSNLRSIRNIRELTGRLRNDEVPQAISALEIDCDAYSENTPIDVCLASNILEVGVDIDRLSLMSVVGQPKTTSQYIQVTGRVGRQWKDRPGLIITIYTVSKPRDRSHYEKFRSYHERLYAQVEPVSVTPFSPPILDRALHAIMVLYARQTGGKSISNSPYPYPARFIESLREILMPRVKMIDPTEVTNFESVFNKRVNEWKRWQRTEWGSMYSFDMSPNTPLLRPAGSYTNNEMKELSWSTPTSMRTVDAECNAQVTTMYLQNEEEE